MGGGLCRICIYEQYEYSVQKMKYRIFYTDILHNVLEFALCFSSKYCWFGGNYVQYASMNNIHIQYRRWNGEYSIQIYSITFLEFVLCLSSKCCRFLGNYVQYASTYASVDHTTKLILDIKIKKIFSWFINHDLRFSNIYLYYRIMQ